jgi:hypothetical protein
MLGSYVDFYQITWHHIANRDMITTTPFTECTTKLSHPYWQRLRKLGEFAEYCQFSRLVPVGARGTNMMEDSNDADGSRWWRSGRTSTASCV